MCIDYTSLNRHFPKDPFPLPCIDQVVDSTTRIILLCFLDCYSGYHQLALKVSKQGKTVFITSHGIYCYTTMTFGLKNAGATYQKAIQKCLESQIGDNIKAYVDDVVVKPTVEDNLITDLVRTFANLCRYRWKLNPEKCVFGVPSGKLLGFMVSHQGIKANPTKVDAIRNMKRPTMKGGPFSPMLLMKRPRRWAVAPGGAGDGARRGITGEGGSRLRGTVCDTDWTGSKRRTV
jgi:hypothetical protein